MYEKWLADDGDKLRVTKASILELREKIQAVRNGQNAAQAGYDAKDEALARKEQMLTVSQLGPSHKYAYTPRSHPHLGIIRTCMFNCVRRTT